MYRYVKRGVCVVASGTALVVLSPIFLVATAGILISDRGPVFYKANRMGKDNRPFRMYKFRSMRVDKKADESSFKADVDRIFPWGAFMRASKIDELPQLLNCFVGDMAIVGPRPAAKDQLAIVRAGKYAVASSVRPGLTGPAALYDYLYGDTIVDEKEYEKKILPTRLELEAEYVKHVNAGFDLKMIWWTVRCIFGTLIGRRQESILRQLEAYAEAR